MAVNAGGAGAVPRIGMVATVRNRRGVISAVQPFDGPEGRLHLVDVEYNDGDAPQEETLLWEREPGARVIEATALPTLYGSAPMAPADFDALVRSCRWSARLPYIDPDGSGPLGRLPVCSPFFGAIQVEDYQLVPLLTALRMPRVTLLLADDVGLGKTVEAGLILTELILRRRIRRVLILTPASLRTQWRDEMWEKFSLPFEVVDRDATRRLRRQLGMDANPWRSHSRIVASYHYLKQPDVLEEFRSASRIDGDPARLPWDLLIVDEAHNLAPSPLGEDSDVCSTLREIAPLFEHRLFLTATPHNGFTSSFTGLLEMLDPVRFTRSSSMSDSERLRIEDVVVRRLKSEINAASVQPRFSARRPPAGLRLSLRSEEAGLSAAFASLREAIHRAIQRRAQREQTVGSFAVEILGKRLLSCPVAFAESWRRCRAGMEGSDAVDAAEVLAAKRAVEQENTDDGEVESQRGAAAAAVGAWLRPLRDDLKGPIEQVDAALARLGFTEETAPINTDPTADARYEALRALIKERLLNEGGWRSDERLVIFTEYKTTLDYLVRRLEAEAFCEKGRVESLFGGMDEEPRIAVKAAFNDPDAPVRILVATDAASEGLNLQATARFLLHFDIPWNPARLEQRNGRLDRHGQAREVSVWYFFTDEDRDLAFLGHIVNKVDAIRGDLGATCDVLDDATRRLVQGEDPALIQQDMDAHLAALQGAVDIPRDAKVAAGVASPLAVAGERPATIDEVMAELDLGPEPLRTTLDAAMAIRAGRPRVEPPDEKGRCRIVMPPPPPWAPTIDETIRAKDSRGQLRALAFDPASFVSTATGFPVFRSRPDTALMHLGHPLFQRALSVLSRQRFPGGDDGASRWTIRRGPVGPDADALLILTVEELAVNELREMFHHWVRSIRFPLVNHRLGAPLEHVPAAQLHAGDAPALGDDEVERARNLWQDVESDLREHLAGRRERLTEELTQQLEAERMRADREARDRFHGRSAELSVLIQQTTIAHLEREIEEIKRKRTQGDLFRQAAKMLETGRDLDAKEEELRRRRVRTEELRRQLEAEKKRVLEDLLPRRYSMRGQAQILPVAVEFVLPGDVR